MRLQAPLLPAHNYTLEVMPADSPSSVALYSDEAFGRQPLETREAGVPDAIAFTSQRLPQGMQMPLSSGFLVTILQV